MICKKCNSMNPDDAKVCIICGAELEKGKKNITNFKKIEKKKPKQLSTRRKMNFRINDKLLLFGLILLLVLGFYLFNKGNGDFSNALNLVTKIQKSNALADTLKSSADSLEIAEKLRLENLKLKKQKRIQNRKNANLKPRKKEKIFQTYISSKDSMKMILIPAEVAIIGSNDKDENEKFAHKVTFRSIYIDEHEVTNKQYRKFIEETGYKISKYLNNPKFNAPNQPVVGVTFNDAKAYATWAGKRLPTEEEWERAARGGKKEAVYATGKTISHKLACYNLDSKTDNPADVKSYDANFYKLYEMSGNVSEWTSSMAKVYSTGKYLKNFDGSYRVLRGGSWKSSKKELEISNRKFRGVKWLGNDIGFRCVLDN